MIDGTKTKFVVGLGNPHLEYRDTRHNVGFMVLKELRKRWNFGRARRKFLAKYWSGTIGQNKVVLLAPQTYMNRSGESVARIVEFYKIDLPNILVVMDDMALPVGRIRIRPSGSAGGHKGLGNILEMLGTNEIARLRIGIGQPPEGVDPVDYVLGKFNDDEKILISKSIILAIEAIEEWVKKEITYVMNRYNKREIDLNKGIAGSNQ